MLNIQKSKGPDFFALGMTPKIKQKLVNCLVRERGLQISLLYIYFGLQVYATNIVDYK